MTEWALTIALNHPALSRRYAEIETQRQAAAEARFERVRQGTENLNISTHEPWPGYYACDGQLFDGLTHRRLHVWHLKPALARDESYRALVQMLRREFPGHWSATGST